METIATPKKTIDILKKHNLRLSKSLGQNFLVDQNILEKIIEVSKLSSKDKVIEIGAGIGTLTLALAQKAKSVVAVELDKKFIPPLKETLKNFKNVKIIAGDALKLDLNKLQPHFKPNKMVSNLPYNIATPILAKFLENYPQINSYTIMVQKEVAERLVAKPGKKDYGPISLKIYYFTEAKLIAKISRNVFLPSPEVSSAIVKLERLKKPRVKVKGEKHLFKVISAAFSQRRKTLRNTLASGLALKTEEVEKALKRLEIDSKRRGETLSLEEFTRLSDALNQLLSH